MGRVRLSLPIHGDSLRRLIMKGGKGALVMAAKECGITRQQLHNWLSQGIISPRGLVEIARHLNLSADEVKLLRREDPNLTDLNREVTKLRNENLKLKAAIAELAK